MALASFSNSSNDFDSTCLIASSRSRVVFVVVVFDDGHRENVGVGIESEFVGHFIGRAGVPAGQLRQILAHLAQAARTVWPNCIKTLAFDGANSIYCFVHHDTNEDNQSGSNGLALCGPAADASRRELAHPQALDVSPRPPEGCNSAGQTRPRNTTGYPIPLTRYRKFPCNVRISAT